MASLLRRVGATAEGLGLNHMVDTLGCHDKNFILEEMESVGLEAGRSFNGLWWSFASEMEKTKIKDCVPGQQEVDPEPGYVCK